MSTETQVITETTKAATTITKATTGLAKVVAELGQTVQIHEGLMGEIAEAQQTLNQVNKSVEIAEREAAAELSLRIKENEGVVLRTLMEKAGLAYIAKTDLDNLNQELRSSLASNEDAVKKEVAIAVNQQKAKGEKELAEAQAQHKVDVAEKDADIKAQTREIEFLNKQVTALEKTVDEERKARIEIAKAESQKEGVVVNNGK